MFCLKFHFSNFFIFRNIFYIQYFFVIGNEDSLLQIVEVSGISLLVMFLCLLWVIFIILWAFHIVFFRLLIRNVLGAF